MIHEDIHKSANRFSKIFCADLAVYSPGCDEPDYFPLSLYR